MIPDELGLKVESIGRSNEPVRFWMFVIGFFIVATLAIAYGCWLLMNG